MFCHVSEEGKTCSAHVLDIFKLTHHLHQLPFFSFGTVLFVCVVWVLIHVVFCAFLYLFLSEIQCLINMLQIVVTD